MAPKRRVVQADSDNEEGSQASKRPRQTTESEDEEEEVHVRRAQRNAKGKGRARATDEDADADDQVEEIIPDADEEKRFEEEHEDKVRALVLGKKPTQGVSLVNLTMNPLRFGVLLDPMHQCLRSLQSL